MKAREKYSYPITLKSLRQYAESIFNPIKEGESVTAIWVPMAGRRMVTKFVIENIGLFKKALPNPKKYLLIYVEPLDLTEESLAGYLRLMGLSFIDVCRQNPKCISLVDKEEEFFRDESIGYARLLGKLKELVKRAISQGFRGFEVVFFLGEFDELTFANKIFYNNLKSLWSSLSPSLHFVFLMRENITESQLIKKFCELSETILQNVVFVPLLTKEDIEHLIALNEKRLRISFTPSEKKTMTKVCGTHPFLLKTACRITAKTREKTSKNGLEEVLARNYELKSAASVMWEVLTPKEREFMLGVAHAQVEKVPFERESLKSLGLIKEEKGKTVVFNQLLANHILAGHQVKPLPKVADKEKKSQKLTIEEETSTILLNRKPIEEYFTRQEYTVLSLMIRKGGRLCSRDDIGEALWGEDSYEKYSNWAIDQLISKLRKKIKKLGIKNGLKTIRGRGYKLTL